MGRTNVTALVFVLLVLFSPVAAGWTGEGSGPGPVPEGTANDPVGTTAVDNGPDPAVPVTDTPLTSSMGIGAPFAKGRPSIDSTGLAGGSGIPSMVPFDGEVFGRNSRMTGQAASSDLTRASDLEKEKGYYDCANGSVVDVPMEVVSGTLSYDPEGQSDLRDWYKLRLEDVDPTPSSPNGLHWIRLHLLSYSNFTGGTEGLYEYRVIDGTPPSLESDYGDVLGITVLYYDPWQGLTYLGGDVFFYDDMDDTDDTSYRSGWYFNSTSPVPSTGPEDLDGFANGLTEVGWYYIGINLDFYIRTDAPQRDAYGVRYEMLIDTSERIGSDEGANVRELALENVPSGESTISSNTDHVDWYSFEGSDPAKIWNQTFVVNRTMGLGGRIGEILYDTWAHVWVVHRDPGDDGVYGTSDDGWGGYYFIFSFFLSGGNFISTASQSVELTIPNTYIDSNDRKVYLGIYVEPAKILISGSTIIAFLDPDWSTFTNVTIDYRLREERLNRRPVISGLSVSSSNPNYPTQGDLRDTFSFEVTYTDPDDDPPERLDLFVGPKQNVWTMYSLLEEEKDRSDLKYSDGKTYLLILTGEQLGSYPIHHYIMANATDLIEVWSLRVQLGSADRWLNDTLLVFDDRPVGLNDDFEGIDVLTEDGGKYAFHLERRTGNGPFDDPENDFRGFNLWDVAQNRWVTEASQGPLTVNISLDPSEGWMLNLEPLPNAHGGTTLRLRAYDDHSSIERSVDVEVESVNDPPAFVSAVAGTRTFGAVEVAPSRFRVDLKGQYDLNEDSTYRMALNAIDTDPEEDRTTLVFGFVASRSDNWDIDPVIDSTTGEVTIRPTNNDVIRKSSILTFEVHDGDDGAELELLVTVKNANDPPEISVSDSSLEVDQGDRVRIQPVGRDMDPGDTLVYSVNFEEDLGSQYGSVVSQLPYFVPVKGEDWDLDPKNGEVWFEPSDDDIWRDLDALLMERVIHVMVQVRDSAGATASVEVTMRLIKNDIWVPWTPLFTYTIEDEDEVTPGVQGLTIGLEAGGFDSTLYPGWEYSWDLGDGSRRTGRSFTYTYLQGGYRTISLRLTKDAFSSGARFLNITFEEPVEPEEPPAGGNGGGNELVIIAIVAVVILVIIVVVAVLLMMRGRKGSGEGPERPEMHEAKRPQPSEPHRRPASQPQQDGRCPKCGAPVRAGWFLCPSCKTPLG